MFIEALMDNKEEAKRLRDSFGYNDKIESDFEKPEQWKTIPGAPDYQASSLGRIRNAGTLRVLSMASNGGYLKISLMEKEGGRKTYRLHRLIAAAFIPNPENKATVNHVNHDKQDNRVENLEWATTTEQNRHKRKREEKEHYLNAARAVWKCDMNGVKLQRYESIKLASIAVTGSQKGKSTICAVARRRIDGYGSYVHKSAYGYKWEYEETEDHPGEEWRDLDPLYVKCVEGYKISSHGRIRNRNGRVGVPYVGTCGYMWVSMHPHHFRVHILVAKAFVGYDPNIRLIVNHKDGNKTNCKAENLEWVTASENAQHAHDTGLNPTGRQVAMLDTVGNIIKTYPNCKKAAIEVGVKSRYINKAAKENTYAGKRYTAGGVAWAYI